MTYGILVTHYESYIQVTLTADSGANELSTKWGTVAQACKRYSCDKLLVESQIEVPRTTLQIYDLAYYLTTFGINQNHKVAFVVQGEIGDLRIGEEMIRNALANGRTFTDIDEAKAWLLR